MSQSNYLYWIHSYIFTVKSNIIFITDTPESEIEDTFKRFIKRDDIDIILINQNVSKFIETL